MVDVCPFSIPTITWRKLIEAGSRFEAFLKPFVAFCNKLNYITGFKSFNSLFKHGVSQRILSKYYL